LNRIQIAHKYNLYEKQYFPADSLHIFFYIFGQNNQQANEYTKAREIIKDLDSIVSPNGIQERYKADIGGIKQWVYVRGQNKEKPIILFVHEVRHLRFPNNVDVSKAN
jgi:hypothetical protein